MLKINELKRLDLGIKGENESKTLQIDMSAWASLYPNATAEILHKRSGDNTKALTGATYDSDTMILTWIPTTTDTYYEGFGVAEIRMVEGNVVKKTKDLIVTAVCPSVIDGSGTIIESTYQAFLNSVISTKQGAVAAKVAAETAQGLAEDAADDAEASADDAEAAAEAAEAAVAHGPYVDETTGNWMVWDVDTGAYVDTGVHAQGPKGDPGSIENVTATQIKMSAEDTTTVYNAIQARANKVSGGTSGNFAAIDENGDLTDSGHKHSDYVTDLSGKADKVSGAVSGNFAGLDSNGNLTDSGSKASDFLTQHQDISGKANKVSSATSGNFAGLDANGDLTDSGHKHSDYLTQHQDISGKADKVSGATNGNFAGLDGNGNLTDSGSKASDFLTQHQDISGKLDKSDFYATQMPMSSSDSTKLSSKLSAMDSSTSDIRKGLSYVAKLTSGNWQLNSGQNAAIGDYISVNGKLGRATAAITGGSTNIVENTNWVKEGDDGGLNELVKKDQGIANAGKALGIGNDGMVTPVPFSGEDFTGATASTAGVHGYVPAPAAGDQNKVLTGGGTWQVAPGAKLITVDLDTITNVSGSYTGTTSDERVTSDMKPVTLILGTPGVIRDKPTVTCNNGSITFSCSEVVGTTTAQVSVIKVIADPTEVTSTEFDILNNRIGTLSDLTTTAKTSAVAAINELDSDISTLNAKMPQFYRKTSSATEIPSNYNSASTNGEVSVTTTLKSAEIKLLGLWVDYLSPAGWMMISSPQVGTDANGYMTIACQLRNHYSSALNATVGFAVAYVNAS